MLTIVMSGPISSRSMMLTALDRAGANVDWQPEIGKSHGLPVEGLGWVTATADELGIAETALQSVPGWALRLHSSTPKCPACQGVPKGATCLHCLGANYTSKPLAPVDPMAELAQRVARLEAVR